MKKSHCQSVLKTLFFLYCLGLLWLLFFREPTLLPGHSYWEQLRYNSNIRPLYTIRNYLRVILLHTNPAVYRHCLVNLTGNVLLFIPIGGFLPLLFPRMRNFFRFFFLCAGSVLLVETTQLLSLLGSFDVDDILLNLTGLILGYLLYQLFHFLFKKKKGA